MSVGVSTTSYRRMMWGCMKRRKIFISRRTALACQRQARALRLRARSARAFLVHVHSLNLFAVQDLDSHLVPSQRVLRHLHLCGAEMGSAAECAAVSPCRTSLCRASGERGGETRAETEVPGALHDARYAPSTCGSSAGKTRPACPVQAEERPRRGQSVKRAQRNSGGVAHRHSGSETSGACSGTKRSTL